MRRLLCLALFAALALPCLPRPSAAEPALQRAPFNQDFWEWSNHFPRPDIASASAEGHALGAIPEPVDLSHLAYSAPELPFAIAGYAASFDLRTLGKVTAVGNQTTCGACWAFATYGSLESALLTGETRDFSENHLKNLAGFDLTHCAGGNATMSAAYMSRRTGPVWETDDPYNPGSNVSPAGLSPRKTLTQAIFLPDRTSSTDNDTIKYALTTWGAVMTNVYWDDAYYSATNRSYRYAGAETKINHAVTIVGWDDAYSAANFTSPAGGNGAFLVKNSWGTAWGNSGYFWLSYYDPRVSSNRVFQQAPAAVAGEVVYLHDPLGWVGNVGYGTTSWAANIFTSTTAKSLASVSTYMTANQADWQVQVYVDVGATPNSGTLALTQTGHSDWSGYVAIPLSKRIPMTVGRKFSVVFRYIMPSYAYPIPIEYAYATYSSLATASAGQSFISSSGNTWSDATAIVNATANVCIEAVASPCASTADCSDGDACTDDVCNGDGTCSNPITAGKCRIGGACYTSGAASGKCLECVPATSQTAWTYVTNKVCNDGVACSSTDKCVAGGTGDAGCAGTTYSCDDGKACTADSCNGDGTCTRITTAGNCLIGGTCYATSAANGKCLECVPATSQTAWTYVTNKVCTDGVACTSSDKCVAGGTGDAGCAGTTYSCDDGKACTADSCNGDGTCTNTITAGNCLIGGTCYASNAANGKCLECVPATSQTAWTYVTNKTCNDGVACTSTDKCVAGGSGDAGCAGTTYSCDDGKACTADSCNGDGTCTNTITAGNCLIGGTCHATSDANGKCLECVPATNPTAWTYVTNKSCDDGIACTSTDKCAAGGTGDAGCAGTTYRCDDGFDCTSDSCRGDGTCSFVLQAAWCLIDGTCVAEGMLHGMCQTCRPADADTAWTLVPGQACDDGNPCTSGDACAAGGTGDAACHGTAYDCDDGVACTADSCNGDGTCTNALADGWCVIEGACVASGTARGMCEECRPATHTSAWTYVAGKACNDGVACTAGDACTTGGTGNEGCAGTTYSCDDLRACTQDTCLGDGTCANTLETGWCLVSGTCVARGQESAGGCLACDPTANPGAWTPRPDDTACNDEDPATGADRCTAGACAGVPCSCQAADPCCDGCLPRNEGGDCEDGSACTDQDQCVAGLCAAGVQRTCPPPATCHDGGTCQPATGTCTRPALTDQSPCDDGDPLTTGDRCIAGMCVGIGCTCAGVGACCDGCLPRNEGGLCDDGDGCTPADHCVTGACVGGEPIACPAPATCRRQGTCDPATGTCGQSLLGAETPCDDEDPCTDPDQCTADGTCTGPVGPACLPVDPGPEPIPDEGSGTRDEGTADTGLEEVATDTVGENVADAVEDPGTKDPGPAGELPQDGGTTDPGTDQTVADNVAPPRDPGTAELAGDGTVTIPDAAVGTDPGSLAGKAGGCTAGGTGGTGALPVLMAALWGMVAAWRIRRRPRHPDRP